MSIEFVKELLEKDCDLTPKRGKSGITHSRKGSAKKNKSTVTVYRLHLPKAKQDY